MTGYKIAVGYNSEFAASEVWETLKTVGLEIANNPEVIACEAAYYDGDYLFAELREVSERFKVRDDLTIRFFEGSKENEFRPHILMYASGGGRYRLIKESTRRAYCRLVLKEMHKRKMEIDIYVG